jgi:hypothetical protein
MDVHFDFLRGLDCDNAYADRFFFAFWDFAVVGGFLTAATFAA